MSDAIRDFQNLSIHKDKPAPKRTTEKGTPVRERTVKGTRRFKGKPRKNEETEGITVSPEGPLEERVYAEAAESGADSPEGWLEDLATHGAQSGMWMEIVTYHEAPAFYHKYQNEIDGMLKELCSDTGSTPGELFARAGWDEEDFFAREDLNQTLLASFGAEEAARHMLERAGWEG